MDIIETGKIAKLITGITSKFKEKETENNKKDEIRTIVMENKISLGANSEIHRIDHNYNPDTFKKIQDIFISCILNIYIYIDIIYILYIII